MECLTVSTPARFLSAVARITLAAFRSHSRVNPQVSHWNVRSDRLRWVLVIAPQPEHVIVMWTGRTITTVQPACLAQVSSSRRSTPLDWSTVLHAIVVWVSIFGLKFSTAIRPCEATTLRAHWRAPTGSTPNGNDATHQGGHAPLPRRGTTGNCSGKCSGIIPHVDNQKNV